MPSPMKDSAWKVPVKSRISTRKILSTVRMTTAAEANRTTCERSHTPAANNSTPKASHTAEYVYCPASVVGPAVSTSP
ncbi:MAG TPA: hypothetical protein VH600_14330 [Burkholderiales bacterium]|jgi:hypothetical protein